MIKPLLVTAGSRGDILPFIWLSQELNANGSDTLLCTPRGRPDFYDKFDVKFFPLVRNLPETRKETRQSGLYSLFGGLHRYSTVNLVKQFRCSLLSGIAEAGREDTDIVVYHAALPGNQLAEWLGVPSVAVCFEPCWIPTGSVQSAVFPMRIPHLMNKTSYLWPNLAKWRLVGRTAKWRLETLGLKYRPGCESTLLHADRRHAPVINAFSEHMFTTKLHFPNWVCTSGFWFPRMLPHEELDAQISEFASSNVPTIYIGFGGRACYTETILESVRRTGVKAIVGSNKLGRNEIERSHKNILSVSEVPFHLLFQKLSAVVHHGGVGTTAAALFAGVPQIVFPFKNRKIQATRKMRFNAQKLYAKGVAPRPRTYDKLDADSLCGAIEAVITNVEMSNRARQLGERVRAEDGLSNAMDVINRNYCF